MVCGAPLRPFRTCTVLVQIEMLLSIKFQVQKKEDVTQLLMFLFFTDYMLK